MGTGLSAITQVRKMACKVKGEENSTFTDSFTGGISRERDQYDQVKWEPEARTPSEVNEGGT
jgi:hypothetical protein